jgi:NAD(P)-dependent dehydrogenase (short-subunit alcohol dehydrogenase family)
MKTIVITGASRGIGLATAKKFLAEGWRVIGTYNNTPIPLENRNLTAVHLDLAQKASRDQAVQEISAAISSIDALINNAAVTLDYNLSSIDLQKVRTTFEINLFAQIDLTEQLLPYMQEEAHIVNVDSTYGAFSFPIDDETSAGYRMAKAALNMYTRILAFRLRNNEMVVSSLDPGWVKTDMGSSVATDDEGPDREPEEPAEEIFNLVTRVKESGCFWQFGKKREW